MPRRSYEKAGAFSASEVGSALGVDLEVERLAHDQSDHPIFVEDAVAAEHAPAPDTPEPLEDLRQAVGETTWPGLQQLGVMDEVVGHEALDEVVAVVVAFDAGAA